MSPLVSVFAKAPVIGGAKTRLARGVGRVEAWRLHRSMTAALLRRLVDPCWRLELRVAPDAAITRRFPGVWPETVSRAPQGGGDLGARQARLFARRGPTIVIGSDAPDITRDHIRRAFRLLRRHDAVVGPARDGGYWLLALHGPAPAGVFDGVRWSTAHALGDLEARLAQAGLGRTARLEALSDVDEAADLKRIGRPR